MYVVHKSNNRGLKFHLVLHTQRQPLEAPLNLDTIAGTMEMTNIYRDTFRINFQRADTRQETLNFPGRAPHAEKLSSPLTKASQRLTRKLTQLIRSDAVCY